MRRGEIRWGTPALPGSERKRRPFLIVSDDAFNTNDRWHKVMVIHLTSVQRLGAPFDWEVALPKGSARLPKASIAKCGEVYTLFKDQLGDLLGSLPREVMQRIDRALAVALGLPVDGLPLF